MSTPKDKAEKYIQKESCQSPPTTPRPTTPPPVVFNAIRPLKETVLTVDIDGVALLQKNIKYVQNQKLKASRAKAEPIQTKIIHVQSKK